MYLTFKYKFEYLDITQIKGIVNGFFSLTSVHTPDFRVLREEINNGSEFLLVEHIHKHRGTIGVKVYHRGMKPLSVGGTHGGLIERYSEGVRSDVDGINISTDT